MKAFDELYGRYEKRLFCFIRRYLSRKEDAEEVFHEAFMKVLKSGKSNLIGEVSVPGSTGLRET